MKLRPVRQHEPPSYPTQHAIASQRDLHENLPTRWQLSKKLAGAGSLLVAAGLTGCGADTSTPPVQHPEPVVREASDWTRSIFEDPAVQPRALVMGAVAISIPPEDDLSMPLDDVSMQPEDLLIPEELLEPEFLLDPKDEGETP